mmetsp:Transcript_27297/g.56916  ORF Transcript_27297/g.56916 Transcript_27297/m.56916 type:complete len:397 (+) Transcript_27297:95-1285(+)
MCSRIRIHYLTTSNTTLHSRRRNRSSHPLGENSSQILLQTHRVIVIRTPLPIVHLAIIDHLHHIRIQHVLILVPIALPYPLLHGAQIDRIVDDLEVILHLLGIHRIAEAPRELLIGNLVHERHELSLQLVLLLIGVLRPAGDREEVGDGPSRLDDAGDGERSFRGSRVDVVVVAAADAAAGRRRSVIGKEEGAPARYRRRRVPHDVGEVARKRGINHLVRLGRGAHALEHEVPLRGDRLGNAREVDRGMDVTLHDGPAVVILDESLIPSLGHLHCLGESLLLEVPDGVIVGVRYEVLDSLGNRVHLEQVHQFGSVALHLLRCADGAECDFGESHFGIGAVAYAADDLVVAAILLVGIGRQQREGFVTSIEDEAGDVLLWHFGELFREEGFEADESD